jgi:cytosine/adenosine deaminase-related metal-dependent hydrolase
MAREVSRSRRMLAFKMPASLRSASYRAVAVKRSMRAVSSLHPDSWMCIPTTMARSRGNNGLHPRGLLQVGYKADVNVIDFDRLHLHAPHATYDLPAGGRRLSQKARGYEATIVSGQITYREGEATSALPGRLVRSSPARRAPGESG